MADSSGAITTGGGGGDEAPHTVLPHLDDGIVTEILHRLPTKDAYRSTAVCPRWRAIVSEPAFLSRHLSPRPLPFLDDGPYTIILQPRRKVGYTHLTLIATNPGDRVDLNLPIDPKYTDKPAKAPPRKITSKPPPAPSLLDTAADSFILNVLYSTGADADEVRDHDASEEPDQLVGGGADEVRDDIADQLADGNAVVGEVREDHASEEPDQLVGGAAASEDEAAEAESAAAPSPVEVEDYVAFFERTVPMLDISIVASHGRLLLCRSRSRYYVCDPAANRWLVLPPSSFPPTHDTATGVNYNLNTATGGCLSFTVVLLVRIPQRRVHVETFSSTTGRWDTEVVGAQGVARCLGVASPGIHVGTCFYWLSRRRGRVVRYDVASGRASVVREPPEAEGACERMARALGSAGGRRLRLCAFDIRDEHESMLPHEDIEGVHGVWVMDAPAAAWRRVHEAVVSDISAWYFNMLWGHEVPVDFAGACGEYIVVEKEKLLLRYDLENGRKVTLASLYRNGGRLSALYRHYRAFPFFRPR